MIRHLLARRAPAGPEGRLTVLIYHRVLAVPDPLFPEIPDAVEFERRMRRIAQWFNVLPLAEAVERLQARALPERALAITFDDGYADNLEVAAPILHRLGLRATFFLSTGVLDGGRMWNDTVIEAIRRSRAERIDLAGVGLGKFALTDLRTRRRAIDEILMHIKHRPADQRRCAVDAVAAAAGVVLPDDLMLRTSRLREFLGMGMTLGAHTVSHPILTTLDDDMSRREILESKAHIEAAIGEPVRLFAYPNGMPGRDYERRHVEMVRELGFAAAVSTAPGVCVAHSDPLQLPRFTPWQPQPARQLAALWTNLRIVEPQRV